MSGLMGHTQTGRPAPPSGPPHVPVVPGLPRGIHSGRAVSLPPDGLLCNYTTHLCHGQRLQGYEFCIRHILEDKTAAYKPCAFSGETQGGQVTRCPRAAPRTSRGEGYCREHSRAVVSARHRLAKRHTKDREGLGEARQAQLQAQALLDTLPQYRPGSKADTGESPASNTRPAPEVRGSDSEEEGGALHRVSSYCPGDGESEAESVDSEGEDSLKHAGVYTGEEVMRTMRDKLIRLQKLYIEQFGRLQHKLRESRRGYLAQVREEREAGMMNIYSQPRQHNQYQRLKALTHYHAPAGREALLAARHREKRVRHEKQRGPSAASLGGGPGATQGLPLGVQPCQHALTQTQKCGQGVIPMARFCPRHILEQPGQVLYRACAVTVEVGEGPCPTPLPNLFPHSTCVFHTRLQPTQSLGAEQVKTEAVPDIGSLVTEVLTAANNPDTINNDASQEAAPTLPNREEPPEIKDEIENVHEEDLDMEIGATVKEEQEDEEDKHTTHNKDELMDSLS